MTRHADRGRSGPRARRPFLVTVLLATGATGCAEAPLQPSVPPDLSPPAPTVLPIGSPVVFRVTERQVTTDPAAQFDPSLQGDIVVYTDRRNGNEDIYYTNLLTGVEVQVTTAESPQRLHDVSGRFIVFGDFGTVPASIGIHDIVAGTTQPLRFTGFPQNEPTIDGDRVTFETYLNPSSGNGDIALVRISTGEYRVLTSTPEHEGRPTVGGNFIVYERGSFPLDPAGGIVVYDLTTGTETVVGTGLEPHTDGRRVAWTVGAASVRDIVVRDMATGETTTIAYAGAQSRPRLSGDFIAFDDNSTGNADVVLMHLPTGQVHRFGTAFTEVLNDLDGQRLAFTTNRPGNLDIFVAEFTLGYGDIDVAPAAVNFGDVQVASTATRIVTVSNAGEADLTIRSASLGAGSGGFSVRSVTPALPVTIGPGGVVDVELAFAPSAEAGYTGTLVIASDDPDEPTVEVELSGRGADASLARQIEELLAFFDASVGNGTLVGSGSGASADKRRHALRNMLVAAGGMIAAGDIAGACVQLQDAYDRVDGQPQPPDFAAGPAAAELRNRIAALIAQLGCG